jgi:hypothetical protein
MYFLSRKIQNPGDSCASLITKALKHKEESGTAPCILKLSIRWRRVLGLMFPGCLIPREIAPVTLRI